MKKARLTELKAGGAFTMLELLVAMAVLSILVVMLFGMVDAAAKLWRENENRVDAYREARAALNVISADLKNVFSAPNKTYFSTNFVGNVPADSSNSPIFFMTSIPKKAQPSSDNKSDLCAVGYFLRFNKQNVGLSGTDPNVLTKESFNLYRVVRGSKETFANLASGASPFKDLASDPQSEILARNICKLEFLYYQTNSVGGLEDWIPSDARPFPQMVEIKIGSISDEVAKRLDGSDENWKTNNPLILKNMRTFVSRIQIPRPN